MGMEVSGQSLWIASETTAVRQARQFHPRHPNDATKAIPVLPYGPEQSRWFGKRLQETRREH